MVNFVLSFCKITGSSKIFKRHFYLPLLKPLTPKEALRTLRITGKWLLGAKIQHYIPVLKNHREKRSKKCKDYGSKVHERMDDFTYMTPVIDPENESHKLLLKVLDTKTGTGTFVYTVEDKKYNIVFQAQFEAAIRDRDIIDILVSQKSDKIIVKLKDCKKISMEIQYNEGDDELFNGEGATTPEEEKFHHHGKYTMSLAKVFEDKEIKEEEWEQQLKKIMRRRRKHKLECTKAWKQMLKENVKNLDWKKFEEDAKQVIDEINEPASEQPIPMEIDDLEITKNVNETLSQNSELLNQLPTIKDITDVIKNMGAADLHEIETGGEGEQNKKRVSGVKVKLTSGKECFISGQMVHTEEGDVFVPGQTVENEFGSEYAPGITINVDNKPTLISGLIMGEEQRDPMFLPTQSTITSDGQLTFASAPEERPPVQPEEKRLRTKLEKQKKEIEMQRRQEEKEALRMLHIINHFAENIESDDEPDIENEHTEVPVEIILDISDESDGSQSDSDDKASSIELNNSEIEELDIEAIKLKQEQQRLEMERLKQILMDDGMDDIISSLEEKKARLKLKLEELRKLNLNCESNLITYAYDPDAIEIASKITQDKDAINRVGEILLTMTRRLSTLRDKNSIRADNINTNIVSENATDIEQKFNGCSNKLKILFKTALVAANDVYKNRPKDQILALNAIGEIVTDALNADDTVLRELMNLMNTPLDRQEICNTVLKELSQDIKETKVSMLKTIANKCLQPTDLYDYLAKIFESENIVYSSFVKISKLDPELVKVLIEELKVNIKEATTEESAVRLLQECIINSATINLDKNIQQFISSTNEHNLLEFMEEALSFAKALDYEDVVDDLSRPMNLDTCDKKTYEMLKRMLLIRNLSERDYSLKTAIGRIKKNPECAKSDPRIRQLVRESAVLTSNYPPLRNSRDIPIGLMKKQNLLAIEDFLMQRIKIEYPVLISRNSYQAVIPKEAARGVLAGRVSYALIDESGITNFKPMHMTSAISVNKNRERRIDDYLSARGREKSAEPTDNRTYLQAKNNVRKLKKMFNNNRRNAA
ncbi:unnamed protein product [Brassicogethes aeneus]|uniref:Uncharacterized protein n=1 Tax=Brassicogethes aeneus TaxID=1431903 RepID=A0A9P0AZ94_BRAAE|nr:unnamed protein product [Brassicogethes aeneus]